MKLTPVVVAVFVVVGFVVVAFVVVVVIVVVLALFFFVVVPFVLPCSEHRPATPDNQCASKRLKDERKGERSQRCCY